MNHRCCQGKIKYLDIPSAQATVDRMNARPKNKKTKKDRVGYLGVYKCRICSFYHVGHNRI